MLNLASQIEEIWESMCNAAIKLTSKALNLVSNAEELLKVKGFIALFIQTMEVILCLISRCKSFD